MTRAHTIDDLPPVLWHVHLQGLFGLGLSDEAHADYAGEIDKRLAVGARVLGTVREFEGGLEGNTIVHGGIVSDTPLDIREVPALLSHWQGRRNKGGTNLAVFEPIDGKTPLLRAARRLRRRQADPVILGTGFPEAGAGPEWFDRDAADAVADYLDEGFVLQVDDAMGRPEELGWIVHEARQMLELEDLHGVVMMESTTLTNRARWNKSTGIDHPAINMFGGPSILAAGSFGRSVLLEHGVNAPQKFRDYCHCPVYLLARGQDDITAEEVERFAALGYDRWVLQGVGLDSPVAAAARRILSDWRAKRKAEAPSPTPPAGIGGGR